MANLIQLTMGQANELWNLVGLVALTFCSEPTPHASRLPHFRQHPLIGCTDIALAEMKYPFVWLHHCNLFLPASIGMCVRSSTSGIRRDESFDVVLFVQPLA